MFINAYYFRAQMYTIVPKQVREDMQWMADHGTNAVTIGVLEQDLYAAVENMQIIYEEADRVGMKLYATPSRWGGMVAGCPKVPSFFTSTHPETWMLREDGSPAYNSVHGPMSSVHHPATYDFFVRSLEKMLDLVPFAGIVWDELKAVSTKDYSEMAKKNIEDIDNIDRHFDATAEFFDRVNGHVRSLNSDLELCMFVYGFLTGYLVERLAQMENLDSFGLDGRPWFIEDGGVADSSAGAAEPARKFLGSHGPYFYELARKYGKKPLALIENHSMPDDNVPLMEKRLPEILQQDLEHVLYYYYPRSLPTPDLNMNCVGKHLRNLK